MSICIVASVLVSFGLSLHVALIIDNSGSIHQRSLARDSIKWLSDLYAIAPKTLKTDRPILSQKFLLIEWAAASRAMPPNFFSQCLHVPERRPCAN